jgi:hypothetical protein
MKEEHNPRFNFWVLVNGNFIDVCVLEWYKLFGDVQGEHYWKNVVRDSEDFRTRLLRHLGIDEAAFLKEVEALKRYRDKFVAHFDLERTGNISGIDTAKKAVGFYYSYILEHEGVDSLGRADDFDAAYAETEGEARRVYEWADCGAP